MIDAAMKDRLLEFITQEQFLEQTVYIKHDDLCKNTDCTKEQMRGMLAQFNRHGFISDFAYAHHFVQYRARLEGYEFVRKGGFVAHDKLLKLNFEKLLLEIEYLRPKLPERAESLTSILSNITTALGFLFPR